MRLQADISSFNSIVSAQDTLMEEERASAQNLSSRDKSPPGLALEMPRRAAYRRPGTPAFRGFEPRGRAPNLGGTHGPKDLQL